MLKTDASFRVALIVLDAEEGQAASTVFRALEPRFAPLATSIAQAASAAVSRRTHLFVEHQVRTKTNSRAADSISDANAFLHRDSQYLTKRTMFNLTGPATSCSFCLAIDVRLST